MKILMISRATLFSSPGGDTTQVNETASHLRKLGVDVDIKLSDAAINYDEYDLIHFFNIIRPADILPHTRKSKKPYVVSTIFVDYTEADRIAGTGLRKFLSRFVSPDFTEYLKAIARAVVNREWVNDWRYLVWGHRRSIQKIIEGSSMLLPNSQSEYDRVLKEYRRAHAYTVVPNAINHNIFKYRETRDREGCVCVARIEYRKNQLNVIRALKDSPYKLMIVGKPSANHKSYYDECVKEASGNVTFAEHLNQDQLSEIFAKAKVHILASWFETTGLSSLEAAACGCNLVITRKGDQEEYFGSNAYYCDPGDVSSIRKAVDEAYRTEVNPDLLEKIRTHYTWTETARITLEAYKNVLTK